MPTGTSTDQTDRTDLSSHNLAADAVTDSSVNRAIGDELRRVRDDLGWTRGEVVGRMSSDISVQTLANYENGLRPCTVPRLVEICEALEVPTPALVALALQRISVEPGTDTFQIDLRAVVNAKDSSDYSSLRRWAKNRLKYDPDGSGVARLERAALEEMATFFDLPLTDFLRYLRRFIPRRVPRRMMWD